MNTLSKSCHRGDSDKATRYLHTCSYCVQKVYQLCCKKAEDTGQLEGFRICRQAPRVNHLFFADDSLILMGANEEEAKVLNHILDTYEKASCQMINKDKSSILFSPTLTAILGGGWVQHLALCRKL